MALIFTGKSTCVLCGGILGKDEQIGGTPAFIADRADPLFNFQDAGFHLACFERWEHREAFEAKYEQSKIDAARYGPE